MQLTCRHCEKSVEFSGERPSFCQHCGQSLADAADGIHDAATLPPDRATPAKAVTNSGVALKTAATERVGNYRLLRVPGAGGMGAVWEAEQLGTGRGVALKLLSPRLQPTLTSTPR
jgi:eukaryotic-like serine/threonine-protein kinase